jgi:CheY-like chemotaxis protein
LRFNKNFRNNINQDDPSANANQAYPSSSSSDPLSSINGVSSSSGRLALIDFMTVDNHSRLTLTKRVKDVFPIQPSDRIAVYQNTGKINNELVFEVQRRNNIVDRWVVKRNTIGVSSSTIPTITTTAYNNNNNDSTLMDNPKKDGHYYYKEDGNTKTSHNIMLIDDEPDLLLAFKSILSNEGYIIETFSNPKEALKRFLEVNTDKDNNESSTLTTTTTSYYSLVITDIGMPGLNGIQLYQILKALCPNVKILSIYLLLTLHKSMLVHYYL